MSCLEEPRYLKLGLRIHDIIVVVCHMTNELSIGFALSLAVVIVIPTTVRAVARLDQAVSTIYSGAGQVWRGAAAKDAMYEFRADGSAQRDITRMPEDVVPGHSQHAMEITEDSGR